jgi:hypothetical protein
MVARKVFAAFSDVGWGASTEGGTELTLIESIFARDTVWSHSACHRCAARIFGVEVLATVGTPALKQFNREETDSELLRASGGESLARDPSRASVG